MGCLAPEVICKATEHIDEQIEMVARLEEKGYTYRIDDGIYFDTSKFPRYAEFARLDLEGQESGARIGDVPASATRGLRALEVPRPAGKRQQEWDSPWGTRLSRLASRVLGHELEVPGRAASTSTPAASTTSRFTTPTRSRRASAASTCIRGCASGCTTSSSTCAARRCRSRRATSDVLDDLVEQGVPRWRSATSSLQAHYRQQQDLHRRGDGGGRDRLRPPGGPGGRAARGRGESPPTRASSSRCASASARVRDDLNAPPSALAGAWEVARSGDARGRPSAGRCCASSTGPGPRPRTRRLPRRPA